MDLLFFGNELHHEDDSAKSSATDNYKKISSKRKSWHDKKKYVKTYEVKDFFYKTLKIAYND